MFRFASIKVGGDFQPPRLVAVRSNAGGYSIPRSLRYLRYLFWCFFHYANFSAFSATFPCSVSVHAEISSWERHRIFHGHVVIDSHLLAFRPPARQPVENWDGVELKSHTWFRSTVLFRLFRGVMDVTAAGLYV